MAEFEITTLTTFSVHIHSGDGNDTCDGCEPALVQAFYNRISGKRKSEEEKDGTKDAEKELTVEQKRRLINKMMKQEMGLQVNAQNFSLFNFCSNAQPMFL